MSPRRRELNRGLAAAAAALVLSTTASGCYASFEPQTHLVGVDRVDANVGSINLRTMQLVKSPDSDTVGLVGSLLNSGSAPDELTGIQIGDPATGGPISGAAKVALPAGQLVTLGGPGSPSVTVAGADKLILGNFVKVTLAFRDAGSTTLELLIEDDDGALAGYAPAPKTAKPQPPVTPTPTATETPGGPGGTGAAGGH